MTAVSLRCIPEVSHSNLEGHKLNGAMYRARISTKHQSIYIANAKHLCVNPSSKAASRLELWPGLLLVITTITWNSLSLADDCPCQKSTTLSHPTPLPSRVNILTKSLRLTRHICVNTGCMLPFRCAAYNSLYGHLFCHPKPQYCVSEHPIFGATFHRIFLPNFHLVPRLKSGTMPLFPEYVCLVYTEQLDLYLYLPFAFKLRSWICTGIMAGAAAAVLPLGVP